MLVDFCLPIYNEEKILGKNIKALLAFLSRNDFNFNWQLVLIINGSFDQSLTMAKEISLESRGKIKVVELKEAGKGLSLIYYFNKSQADFLIFMDIDLAVSLNDILALLKGVMDEKYDLVIGSRLLPESKIKRSFFRELNSQGYNFLSRLILNHHFSDMQCGFKAIKKEAFKKISPYLKNKSWFFDTELVAYANFFGLKIKEIPVDWSENRYDKRKSKVNVLRDSLIFLSNLIKLKFRLAGINRKQKTENRQ